MTSTLVVSSYIEAHMAWQVVDVWDGYFYQMFYVEVEEQVLERLCPMFIYPNFQLLNLTSGLTVVTNSLHLKYLLFSFFVSTQLNIFSSIFQLYCYLAAMSQNPAVKGPLVLTLYQNIDVIANANHFRGIILKYFHMKINEKSKLNSVAGIRPFNY